MESMTLNEALIRSVRKRKALYDKTEDNYANRIYINQQWKEIGNELGVHSQNARKKWTKLRDYFQKSHKLMTSSKSGPGFEKKRKWYLYDSLLFLLPHLSDKKNWSYISDDSENEDEDGWRLSPKSMARFMSPEESPHAHSWLPEASMTASTRDVDDTQIQSPASTCDVRTVSGPIPVPTMPTSTSNTGCTGMKTRKRKFVERNQRSVLDSEIPFVKEMIKAIKSTVDKNDDDDLFLQSLAPKMKMLDPLTKLECQAEMQLLVLKFIRRVLNPQSTQPVEEQHVNFIQIAKEEQDTSATNFSNLH